MRRLPAAGLSLAVALLVLRSLVHGGYLLQVDTAFGPQPAAVPASLYAPVALVQAALVHLVGGALTGRLYVITAVFLCGYLPMRLLRRSPWYVGAAAGLLGMLNPWVYDRVVEGQWAVVVAAAGLFGWLAAWERLLDRPGWRSAAVLAAIGAIICAFDGHFVGLIAVLLTGGLLHARVWRDRARLRWSIASTGFLALLLTYGVIAFLTGHDHASLATVTRFGGADFAAFQSTPNDHVGLLPALLGLEGFWAERLHRFPLADAGTLWWPVTTLAITAMAVTGAVAGRRHAWLLAAGAAGIVVSASTALPGGVAAASWLAARVPLVAVYREPGKWLALWLLAVVVLSADALSWWGDRRTEGGARRLRRWVRGARSGPAGAALLVACTLLPFGLSIVRETGAVVSPVAYPPDWLAAADRLTGRPESEVAVVLPWHQYEQLPFTGRLVLNPARVVFPGRLILPDDVEIPGAQTEAPSASPIGPPALERHARTCALADAVRREARTVVVETAPGGARNASSLLACGFHVVLGDPGRTVTILSA